MNICKNRTLKNNAKSVSALCIDKNCQLDRNLCVSCISMHQEKGNGQESQQHTMIDLFYLKELLKTESARRKGIYKQFRENKMKEFQKIKNLIVRHLNQMEIQIKQLLSKFEEKDPIIPLQNQITSANPITSQNYNQIGKKLSELMEEKIIKGKHEQEIFIFKECNYQKFDEYFKLDPLIAKATLIQDIIIEQKINESMIKNLQSQIKQEKLTLLTLSIYQDNTQELRYSVNFMNDYQIIQQYEMPDYAVTLPNISELKPEDVLTINIEKAFSISNLSGHTDCINAVAISDNQKYIASGGDNFEVFLWDLKKKMILKKYKGQEYVYHLSFSQDSLRLAVVGYPYDVFIFDISNLNKNDPIFILKGHSDSVLRSFFTKNSNILISGSRDQTLRVWDLNKQKEITINKCTSHIYGIAISNDEKLIGCCCNGGQTYIFDGTDLNQLTEKIPPWEAHHPHAACMEFLQQASVLLTSGVKEIRLWSVQDLLQKKIKYIKEFRTGEENLIWTLNAYPTTSNPQVIVACDGKIKIWKVKNSQLKQTIEVKGAINFFIGHQFALTSDFQKIIIGGNKNLKIYEKIQK